MLIVALATLSLYLNIRVNNGISDDHAGYLAMARQIRLGELPIRDFVDLGSFLHLWLSAGASLAGNFFLPELALSWGFIIAGQAIGVYLVWRGTGSVAAAALTGILAVLLFPRPYSFPKVFVYPASVLLLWNYVDAPSRLRLWSLGLCAAVALLLRFDHGVAVVLTAAGTVLLTHAAQSIRGAARATGELVLAFVAGLLPFLLFLATTVGISTHVESMLAFGRYGLGESERVRWQSFLGQPWLAGQRGTALLYDLVLLLTLGAVAWSAARLMADFKRLGRFSAPTLRLCAVTALWLTSAPMLVRNNFEARIPDASTLVMILAGLVAVPWRTQQVLPRRRLRLAYGALGVTIFALALAGTLRGAGSAISTLTYAAELFAVDGIEKAQDNLAQLRISPPVDGYAEPGFHGRGGLERYLHECTAPADRILVPFFRPQLYVYAERGFAGGQWRYFDFHNSPAEQQLAMETLSRQRVPIAVVRRSDWADLQRQWETLARHIDTRYRRLDSYRPDGEDIEVWVERDRLPARTVSGDLPCFQ